MTLAEAQEALVEGNAFFSSGRLAEAVAAYRRSLALQPGFAVPHFNMGVALRRSGELRAAALAFRDAARRDPGLFLAVQGLVDCISDLVRTAEPVLLPSREAPAPAPAVKGGISIVVCSIDRRRLHAMQRNYRALLGERPHEFVVIGDARSLAEGYNRALARCRYDAVLFSHDDVELVSAGPFERVLAVLQAHDVVGLVGSRAVTGPAVLFAGHPHLRGGIAYPAKPPKTGFVATIFSTECGVLDRMQALDGMFFAARRQVARAIGFDEHTFDGFHFYDLDFTYRAHRGGYRIAVDTDIVAIHGSVGNFDASWERLAQRFKDKFPNLAATGGHIHSYATELADRSALLRFHRELGAVCRLP